MNPFDVIGSLFGFGSGYLGYKGQKETNQANRDIAREANEMNYRMFGENLSFQERMSSTAYQRARADMEAAGINPMLMVSKGGASSPGGGSLQATTGAPQQNAVGAGISSAMQALQLKYEIDNMKETNLNLKQDNALKKAQSTAAIQAANLSSASAQQAEVNRQIAEEQLKGWKKEGEIDNTKFGEIMRYLNRMNPFASSSSHLLRSMR